MAWPNVQSPRSKVVRTGAAVALAMLAAVSGAVAQHVHGAAPPAAEPAPAPRERKILYWYDPMHPQVRGDKPGPSPDHCGMDLVPMYAEDSEAAGAPGAVHISPLKQQL